MISDKPCPSLNRELWVQVTSNMCCDPLVPASGKPLDLLSTYARSLVDNLNIADIALQVSAGDMSVQRWTHMPRKNSSGSAGYH